MARPDDEWYNEPIDDPPDLNDLLFGSQLDTDHHAANLFDKAMFEGDAQAYENLVDYLWDEYGIDFEDAFDWEDFREWYDS